MSLGQPRTFPKAIAIDRSGVPNEQHHIPPASTAAAQIVNNISTNAGEVSQSGDREYFEQLLLEILNSDDALTNGSGPEQDLETSYNLIRIVTNAGLLCLQKDDPFLSVKRLMPQAYSSLAVLLITVKRTPEVLLESGTSDSGIGGMGRVPLLFWLMPKLIALIGRPDDGAFQMQLLDLLIFISAAANRASLRREARLVLSKYLKAIVAGIGDCSLKSRSGCADHR
jgi:hypothetical protein